jgi:hypothetical protein
MVNDKENRLSLFWPKMSHAKRAGTTHTRVTPFKMAWLILGTERYGGTDQIDVALNAHVEVSHAMCTGVTPSLVVPTWLV